MAVNLSALAGAGQQFFNDSGVPLAGGKLYSYAAGTTTPQATYTSSSGSTAHTNPIILNSAGRVATGEIWLTVGSNYKFVLYTSTDVLIATWDNITGVTSNAVGITYVPAGTGAVATTVQTKLRENVSVRDFGAVGDNVTNDTDAIQLAINATPTGGLLYFPAGYTYYCASRLVVNKAMTISAYGATIRFNGTRTGGFNKDAVSITSSNVKIFGGTWKEVFPTVYGGGIFGITFQGVENNSVTPPTYIENVGIQDATIEDWQGEAVVFRMCKNFYASNNVIRNVGYSGVMTLSSTQGVISDNVISDLLPNGNLGENAYGITVTANSNGNTVGRPLSSYISITGNTITNVKTWTGIDCHGDNNLSVVGNVVKNCDFGIGMVSYTDGASTSADQGPTQLSIVGNVITNDPAVYPGRVGTRRGIIVSGRIRSPYNGATGENVTISGNVLSYTGGKDIDESFGAIEVNYINNAVITGNKINDSGSNAIALLSSTNFLVDGNNIFGIDPFNAIQFPTATATFSGNPTAADTITLNGVVCTFSASPSAINSNTAINVLIGANQAATITNLQTILVTARDTGTASVMPNGSLQFASFSNNGTAFVVTYRYPTRMLATNWTVSESSSVIAWSGANLSVPTDDNGAGIRIEQDLATSFLPTGQISNNFIRNPTASGISIRGICQISDSEISYRGNSLSGKGVLYDVVGSSVLTCGSVSNLFENSVTYDLPSISAAGTFEFYLPYPTSTASGTSVSVFPSRYLNGLIMSVQPQTSYVIVQLYNPTAGAINLGNARFAYKYEQLLNFGNYGEMN